MEWSKIEQRRRRLQEDLTIWSEIFLKGAVALGCRKKVASSVILFSTSLLMYVIAFEREIDSSFVVLVTILKHFEKKCIKKY